MMLMKAVLFHAKWKVHQCVKPLNYFARKQALHLRPFLSPSELSLLYFASLILHYVAAHCIFVYLDQGVALSTLF